MLFKQIQYFVAVVEHNSFTKAAEEEFISQSAISQQVSALEKELGVTLLKREHRKFSLTLAGEYFYRESKQVLSQIKEVTQRTREIGQNSGPQLTIGYLPTYNGTLLHQIIADFSESYPEVMIHLVKGTHEELYQHLLHQTIDLALSDQRRMFSEEYVNFELAKLPIQLELAQRNPMSQESCLEMDDINHLPCILITSKAQQQHEAAFYRDTLGFENPFIFAENLEEARLIVTGNRGCLPIETFDDQRTADLGITRVQLTKNQQPILRNYCAFWAKKNQNPYVDPFATIMLSIISTQYTK